MTLTIEALPIRSSWPPTHFWLPSTVLRDLSWRCQVIPLQTLISLYLYDFYLQRHHFAQTMCIINTFGCNIFENLSSVDYTRCLDLMQDIILGIDFLSRLLQFFFF